MADLLAARRMLIPDTQHHRINCGRALQPVNKPAKEAWKGSSESIAAVGPVESVESTL
jgi:hypothetical protein